MMDNVFDAFVYGGVGAGVGAAMGTFFAQRFETSGRARLLKIALPAALAVLGMNFAKPLLSPVIARVTVQNSPTVMRIEVSDSQAARLLKGLESDPLVAAIFEKEPSFKAEAYEKLKKTYGEGGLSALSKASLEIGIKASADFMPSYYQRAQAGDLERAVMLMADNIEFLSEADPATCYGWQFASYGHVRFDYFGLIRALGDERYKIQQEAFGELVRNASISIPVYDEAAGAAIIKKAGIAMLSTLDADKYDLVNGRLAPTSIEDKKAACAALGVMFRTMLESENKDAALRYVFALAAQK